MLCLTFYTALADNLILHRTLLYSMYLGTIIESNYSFSCFNIYFFIFDLITIHIISLREEPKVNFEIAKHGWPK